MVIQGIEGKKCSFITELSTFSVDNVWVMKVINVDEPMQGSSV